MILLFRVLRTKTLPVFNTPPPVFVMYAFEPENAIPDG